MLERWFKLKEHGTDARTEIVAGLTTFLSMAYILAVNPNILSEGGMNRGGVFVATALASALATFVMAFLANYPIALSAGLGLNAYFAYTVCLGELGGEPDAFKVALTAVFVEGIIFIILSLFKVREEIINGIPSNLKNGITVGIGLFIGFIGLRGANIVIPSGSTTVELGSFADPGMTLALIGFIIILVLVYYKVKGAVLIGILATWVLGMIAEAAGWYVVDPAAGVYSVFPSFSEGFMQLGGISETAFKLNFAWVGAHFIQFVAIVFAFLYVDLFDTIGTVVGVADKAGLLDKDGKLPRAGKVLMADAIGTTAGALLGTSTVTSFVESSAGVAEGGKTGLTALTTGIMFLVALVLSPIFLAIPGFATAPALIYVGMLMISSAKNIKFDGEIADVAGAYMAIIMMPLSYSIATGIMFAVLTWVIVKVFERKAKDVSPVMWVVAILFLLRIVTLVTNFQ